MQLLILIEFLIKHHCHAADLFNQFVTAIVNETTYFLFEFLVLVSHLGDSFAHFLELSLLLHTTLFRRLPVLLEPIKYEVNSDVCNRNIVKSQKDLPSFAAILRVI